MANDPDLDSNYTGVFDGHLTPGANPALLLVDMVEAYIRPDSPLYCETAAAAADCAARLVEAAHRAGRQVVYTNVEYEPDGSDGGLFYRKVPSLKLFTRGSAFGAFPENLQPTGSDWVISKKYPSAFFATDLAGRLHEAGVDTLVICGYSTSGCVRASALDTIQSEFAPFVVRDGVADRHPDPHEANLFDLQSKYAEVIDEKAAAAILRAE